MKDISRNDPDFWDKMKRVGVRALRAKKVGRPKAIESPEKLWTLACEYFKEVDENPLSKDDFVKGGEHAGMRLVYRLKRPYTWMGLDNYVFRKGIVHDLSDYRINANGAYGEFRDVVRQIDRVMYEQKFDGAAAGIFHQAIIARELGLHKDDDLGNRDLKVTIVRKQAGDE